VRLESVVKSHRARVDQACGLQRSGAPGHVIASVCVLHAALVFAWKACSFEPSSCLGGNITRSGQSWETAETLSCHLHFKQLDYTFFLTSRD
jgi:hypothetical protein